MQKQKIHLTERQRTLLAITPPKECWLCDMLNKRVRRNKQEGLYLNAKGLDEGELEHLRQIIGHDEEIYKLQEMS